MNTSMVSNTAGSAVFTGDNSNATSLIIIMILMAIVIIGVVAFSIIKKKKGADGSMGKNDTVKNDNDKKE